MGMLGACTMSFTLFHFSVFIVLLVSIEQAHGILKFRHFKHKSETTCIDYTTAYFNQPVDHFGYSNSDVFQQRYLVSNRHWRGAGAPIFFYAGNEGNIVWFCENTGLMWDWAPEFGAMLVFAEHRYYGTSLPYGNDSYKDIQHVGYLTSEQALADFASLIVHIKSSITGAEHSPVVAFGGSYGGMLAAWFRMKYPHSVVGALAASAPIWQFGDLVPCGRFNEIVTADFALSGQNCVDNIRRSWSVINKFAQTAEGLKTLVSTLGLCNDPSLTGDTIKGWMMEAYTYVAMVDYPYPADFLEPLPAWPIKVMCSHLQDSGLTDLQLMQKVRDAINVYFNYTGVVQCFNSSQQATKDLGDQGWGFQACTEMVMPMCSDGVHDMFESSPWNYNAFKAGCISQWGVTPRPNWTLTQYGGRDISAASNIIFSNGKLDPWSGGGVLDSVSESLVAIMISEGAHHLDLRSADPADPPSVIAARKLEKTIIKGWIQQYHEEISAEVIVVSGRYFTNFAMPTVIDSSGRLLLCVVMVTMFMSVVLVVCFTGRRRRDAMTTSEKLQLL